MEYIKIIKDSDVFETPEHENPSSYEERQTVKIIIKNKDNKIGLVTNPVHNLFMLPGGGAESNDLRQEAKREALEETNFYVSISREVGKIEEFRNRNAKHYITTCFVGEVVKKNESDLRTEEEKENELEVQWFTYEEVLEILSNQVQKVKSGEVKFYNTAFNIVRDYYFITAIT